ncbi:MAG TPA: GNAT family N-acetyltransferase [Vicinamibacterales bacterium]|jgi:GNAT superfamily N-acetyltransferase|nr:GNAT family N-acetyltransferase [Vicinamibacterales bacterium]
MSGALDIRPMQRADVEAVAELCGQLGYPATPEHLEERWTVIAGDRGHEVLVAVDAGRVVGWLHVSVRPVLESDRTAEICGLIVDANVRGAGVGLALLTAAERWAAAAGCDAIRVRSRIARERAHTFYEREGYVRVKTQHVFEKPLDSP